MALVADASVGEKALSAKEWLSQSSASQQRRLSPSLMKKSASKSKEGVVSPDRANESLLFSGMNLAHVGSVEVVLQALDMPVGNENAKEYEIPPLSSIFSQWTESKSSRRSSSNLSRKSSAHLVSSEIDLPALDMLICNSNQMREDGIPPLSSTCSPLIKSKSSKSSINQGKRDDGIPPLTSSCSPIIKSKSSKSSSNQGSLPGLVVAPDGVTLVKDRRKCKPRGVLTVGLETSSVSSEGEVELAMLSPSVATVEWVDENWNDTLSPHQSHPGEPNPSCSSVTSKSLRSPRVALNFDFHRDVASNIGEAVELRPEIVPSIQESHDGKESVEGLPAELTFADSDVFFRPDLARDLLPSGKDCSLFPLSSKKQQHVTSAQVISPRMQMSFSDPDHHHHSLDIHQCLQLELQDDVNGSPTIEISERTCDYGSDIIRREHLKHRYSKVKEGEHHVGISENQSSMVKSFGPVSRSPSLLDSPGTEGATNADVPMGSLTNLAYARGAHIVRRKYGGGFGIRGSDLSQQVQYAENQLSPEELVAATLYELAAENLRKTRTGARRFLFLEEKKSQMEASSLRPIVKQSVSSVDTSTSGEPATRTDAVPNVLSSRVSRQVSSRQNLAKVDFAQPLRTIVLSRESNLPQELTALESLIGNVHLEAYDSRVQGLPATIREVNEEVEGPDHSSLALSKKLQRQRRRLNSGYCTNSKSKFRKAQQQQRRFASCGNRVGFGSILAATAAFGVVVISLAMGSCQHCYKSNQYQYYIRPT